MFDPRLLVGYDSSDDACVYSVSDDVAVIETVDFFTPIVDDPYLFGQIAAANALSDVYAMGGVPKLAMNLLCVPSCLPLDTVRAILEGGHDKAVEAGCVIAGGHTIQDDEPKYGLCVTGFVHPQHILKNIGAQPGDVLVLTKALGVGVITTALKAALADDSARDAAYASMAALNAKAAQAVREVSRVHACTDVTGFGLAGHLHEMLEPSGMAAIVNWDTLPLFDRVYEYSQKGCRPGRSFDVQEWAQDFVRKGTMSDDEYNDKMGVLCDPQTSGGLLIALNPADAQAYEARFTELLGRAPYRIGEITFGPTGTIFIR